MTLARRKIDVTIILGTGDFGETGENTVNLSGYRISAQIIKAGGPAMDEATIQIFGLSKSLMNQITRLGRPLDYVRNNTIVISAGDDVAGMSQVFSGTILQAYGDFEGAPESSLNISASAGVLSLAKPVTPLSYPGGASVAVIVSQIAASMDKAFINYGVDTHLGSVYLPGTAMDQLRKVQQAARFFYALDGGQNHDALVIWPRDGGRGDSGPKVSPQSGLVGYPRYCDFGIALTVLYQPGFLFGVSFDLETEITPACGQWNVQGLVYDLEAETPGGAWFMDITAQRLSLAQQ